MHQLAIKPVFSPRRGLNVVVQRTFLLNQQGVIHVAFGSRNDQFELLISAVVEVLAGIVTKNVVVEVLSAPKSMTAIARLALLAL
jgi:hypothetical protein